VWWPGDRLPRAPSVRHMVARAQRHCRRPVPGGRGGRGTPCTGVSATSIALPRPGGGRVGRGRGLLPERWPPRVRRTCNRPPPRRGPRLGSNDRCGPHQVTTRPAAWLPGGTGVPELGGHHPVVTVAVNRRADELLGQMVAVALCGVDQVRPGLRALRVPHHPRNCVHHGLAALESSNRAVTFTATRTTRVHRVEPCMHIPKLTIRVPLACQTAGRAPDADKGT
jgi:hypothetical protein